MKQNFFRFCISALLYWSIDSFTGTFFDMPEKIITLAVFVPPILGLMWGLPAAVGVYVGALLAIPDFQNFIATSPAFTNWLFYFFRTLWVFLAGFLPYFWWHKWFLFSERKPFPIAIHSLIKFIFLFAVTFLVTSAFRSWTATPEELELTSGLFGLNKSAQMFTCFLACFVSDFFSAIFFGLAWFFFLVSRKYNFYNPAKCSAEPHDEENSSNENYRAWLIALGFYSLFPIGIAYINTNQLYGIGNISTWVRFTVECIGAIDIYLILMMYLLLRYRRSIMLEVVFLVTQTVFFTATVVGGGCSVAIGDLIKEHTEESLHEMSVICRERLYRTFFIVRQAVNGMTLEAVDSIESYDRLINDAAYRKNYLEDMKRNFQYTAFGIDGSISYYLRFIPEIEGTKGGFSMQREEARWEGALSPFLQRQPIDLAPYNPDDNEKVGWFYIPMRSHSATWIEPYVDAVTDFYVVSYVAPMFLDGKFIGVVGMDIDFNFIIQELRRMSIYNYGYVYIMNRNNIVLYHRDQPQGSIFQPNPEFQEIETYLTNGMWLGIATPLSEVYAARNEVLMHLIAAIILVAMFISAVSIALASRAIKPLAGMTDAAKRIASGDLNVKISYESGNELGILVRSIREMASKLEYYVYRDKLTGLRNAAAFMTKSKELDEKNKNDANLKYAVIIFDANFLKKVNDNYGHEAGNELLKHAAAVIDRVFGNSFTYRTGGDEYAAILEGEDYENREKLLAKFDEEVDKETFVIEGNTLKVSIARGLAAYESGLEFDAVSKRADAAMYNHKLAIKSKYGEEVR